MLLENKTVLGVFVAATLAARLAAQQPFDESKYPAFDGQWIRVGPIERYDPTKPYGPGQEAPLTPEYQAIFETNLADVAKGGIGDDPVYRCIPEGMPRAMNLIFPMEIVVKRNTTYLLMENPLNLRRIYTDGRDFPIDESPSWMGYSIGRWIDEDGDGHYDVLEVETRNLKNPRTFDSSGIPFHKDAQTIVKERFFLDKTDADTLYDQLTTYDHALTRPWSVMKVMHREHKSIWVETICSENSLHVNIGNQIYMLNDAGELMPMKKDQPPPDLRHFNATGK
jgi:hypothetical protein